MREKIDFVIFGISFVPHWDTDQRNVWLQSISSSESIDSFFEVLDLWWYRIYRNRVFSLFLMILWWMFYLPYSMAYTVEWVSCSIFWITLKPFLLGIFYAEIRCWCTVKHSISSVTFYLITLNLVSLVWFRVSGWLLLSVVCSSWLLIFCLVSLLVLSVTSHFRTIEVRFGVTHIFNGNYHMETVNPNYSVINISLFSLQVHS